MANIIYDSFLNCIKFHKLDNVQLSNYTSRFMDDWQFRRTIQPWEQQLCFYQPWLQSDIIRLQYTSNFGPITLRLYDEDGVLVHTQAFTTHQQDELRPTYFIRQIAVTLSGFDPGKYFFTRDAAGDIFYSEPFEIRPAAEDVDSVFLDDPDPTILIEYSHYEPYQGIKFFVPFTPSIRVPAILKYKQPGAKDNVYEDQLLNQTMINSVPFRLFDFIVGGVKGIPPYFIDKIARIHGCSDLKYDGRLFTKSEGAAFEPVLLDNYPMAGWAIEMREKLNRDSIIIENENIIEGQLAAAILIDSKGFGINPGDTSYSEINYLL